MQEPRTIEYEVVEIVRTDRDVSVRYRSIRDPLAPKVILDVHNLQWMIDGHSGKHRIGAVCEDNRSRYLAVIDRSNDVHLSTVQKAFWLFCKGDFDGLRDLTC